MSTTVTVSLDVSNEQLSKDVKKDIATAFPTDESKEKASTDVAHAIDVNDPVVKKRADEDVKALAETIRSIRASFVAVEADLVRFDGAEFKDSDGVHIELEKKWQPIIQTFDETLQLSLEQATDSSTMMKQISSVLGDVTPTDREDLRLELVNWLKTLESKEKVAKDVKDKFTALADRVRLFEAEIDVALDKADDAIKKDLENAKKHLNDLLEELESLEEKIKTLTIATISEVAVGAAAAGVAIFTLNPVAIFTAVSSFASAIGTGIALDDAMKKKHHTEDEIVTAEQNIKDIEARQELLKNYREKFDETKVLVRGIATKMETIANIWQTINLDMHALHTDLTTNVEAGAPITRFFIKKLQTSKDIYKHLTYLVDTYIEQVHAANPTFFV